MNARLQYVGHDVVKGVSYLCRILYRFAGTDLIRPH